MFSRSRRTVGPRDRRPESASEAHDPELGAVCRVTVVTRGLVLMLAVILVGLVHLTQSSPPVPAAFATCDRFSGYIIALAPASDDQVGHACMADGTLCTWNGGLSQATVGSFQGQVDHVIAAAFTPDGSTLAVADLKGAVSLWDPATRRCWAEIPPRTGWAKALAFSRDGAHLALSDESGVRLWNAKTANPSAGPRLDLRDVASLAFAADGRTLAVGTLDGVVRLWDSAQGSQGARFLAHPAYVKSLAFADHGRVLATSGHLEKIVRLWDVGTGRLLREFAGRSLIQAVAFAPGDRELATAEYDGSVRLWDVATGDSRWGVSENDGPVTALVFSADGATLACGGIGSIRLYRLDVSSRTSSRAP